MKILNENPPKVEWVSIKDFMPSGSPNLFVFGRVNIGSPHECYSTFFARYDDGICKWLDSYGDVIDNEVTHFLIAST